MTTIGSLFTGMGGLDHAVSVLTGAQVAWTSDINPGANKVIAHHWPDIPNLGDITAVDWSQVQPVDIITGGFPCQDISAAGRRGGLIRYGNGSNRSGLWAHMAQAIDKLRPSLVVAENVRGLTFAKADTDPDLLSCVNCVAHARDQSMRALGAVLGDLAGIGYDAAWHGLRASDAGAPHQRFRIFVIAWPFDTELPWCAGPVAGTPDADGLNLLPTPEAKLAGSGPDYARMAREGSGGHDLTTALYLLNKANEDALLPTPSVASATGGQTSRSGDRQGEKLLGGIVQTLLPTPDTGLSPNGHGHRGGTPGNGRQSGSSLEALGKATDWGIYTAAIQRWEALTRPAPPPTQIGSRGGNRLSPAFVEWMMGLDSGHVTDPAIGISRTQQLTVLGNGVVPQQAEMALRHLFSAVTS